jgi:hypothetical protein
MLTNPPPLRRNQKTPQIVGQLNISEQITPAKTSLYENIGCSQSTSWLQNKIAAGPGAGPAATDPVEGGGQPGAQFANCSTRVPNIGFESRK